MKSTNTFRDYLRISAGKIEKELKIIANTQSKSTDKEFSEIIALQKSFTNFWFGGKMLRGTLVRLGYELVNKQSTETIFRPAAAVEILHTALLIHDDIIDKSPTRRGKPSFHIHTNHHYGISQAICMGDIGIALGGKLISSSQFPAEEKNQALQYFLEMINKTIVGEMMDVQSAQETNRTDNQVLQIHKLKTANYTIVGPLTLGAILAGAPKEYIKKIERFAEPLGIAYQIQDDILGIFGDEKKIGKSTISDIEENKSTLLITHALQQATETQQELLRSYYGKKGITPTQQEEIKQIIMQTGALAYSQKMVSQLTMQAKEEISFLSQDEENKQLLTHLCDILLERNT